jgi:hypothetical protein
VIKHSTLIIGIFFILTSISCKKKDNLCLLRDGDFSIVMKGSYRGNLHFLGDGREHREAVEYLRELVETDFAVLDMISNRFYTIPHLGYKFKYAALDMDSSMMMLRYFARIREHPVYAGYQIQFLFDAESRKLKAVYTEEVPLE